MTTAFFVRIVFFIGVAGLWYSGFWVLGSIVTIAYVFRYTAYELIILGWCIDLHFAVNTAPMYMLLAAGLFLVVEWLKPRLLAYTVE